MATSRKTMLKCEYRCMFLNSVDFVRRQQSFIRMILEYDVAIQYYQPLLRCIMLLVVVWASQNHTFLSVSLKLQSFLLRKGVGAVNCTQPIT